MRRARARTEVQPRSRRTLEATAGWLAFALGFAAACTHDFDKFEGAATDGPIPERDAGAKPDAGAPDSGSDAGGPCAAKAMCFSSAESCTATCNSTFQNCRSGCPSGGTGMDCRKACDADLTTCETTCSNTCRGCAGTACEATCP